VAAALDSPEIAHDAAQDAAHLELFRALHEIAVAVGGLLDPLELARIVVERAVALLGADAASVYVWEPQHETLLRLHSSEGRPTARVKRTGAAGQAVKHGVPIHVPDYVTWRHASSTAPANLRAALAVPLRVADRTTGALTIRFHAPHTCSPEQIEVLVLLAAQVAPALEAARLYDDAQRQIREREIAELALRASETRKGAIVEAALDCIVSVDHAGCITEFNPAAERTFGYCRADVVGRVLADIIIPPSLREIDGERFARYFSTGTGTALNSRVETRMLRADGTEFPAELTIVRTQTGDRPSFTGFMRDVTGRHQAEEALRASNELTEYVIANAGEGIIVLDATLRYLIWNPFMEQLSNIPAADVVGKQIFELFPQLGREGTIALLERALGGETVHSGDVRYVMFGSARSGWCSGTYTPRRDQYGKVIGVIGMIHDISERKHAEEALRISEERFRRQYQGTPVPTLSWRRVDDDFVLEDFNTAAEELTEGLVRGWVGQRASLIYVRDRALLADFQTCAVEQRTIHRGQPFDSYAGGKSFKLDLTYVFVPPDMVMMHAEDVTERVRAEADLRHRILHDGLTGLPNRVLLRDRLKHVLRTARREHTPFALLLLDLDRFKDVNDALGHQAGDALLRLMGRRLEGVMREVDTLARLGGDEFAIVLPGIDEAGARLVATRLLLTLEEPFELNGSSLDVGGSLGVAVYPQHGDDAEVFLQRADIAMYVAKRAGGGYAVYEPKHDHHSPERLALHSELRNGIDRDELVLHYQPKFACHDGKLVGVEALVRWAHPRRALLSPDEFIPLAEQSGLIVPLTRWVLDAAVRQCRRWQDDGQNIPIAVNLSMRDLHDSNIMDTIENLLTRWRVAPHLLRVEITESSLMTDPERALATVARLYSLGVHIAIDDFGTGYSSLAYLKKLPVDELKIDRSFVSEMCSDASDYAIVRSTIDLAHNLGLHVVAEGVEDAATWQLLTDLGCDEAQGYHLGRPGLPAALTTWLAPRAS
jgi:diguanylate cyclase (GGDEF)-like protein/PAS domain S-box-containing protein